MYTMQPHRREESGLKTIDLSASELSNLTEHFTDYLAENLESFLIGVHTPPLWQKELKQKIADTIIGGRFKYQDENERSHRVLFH